MNIIQWVTSDSGSKEENNIDVTYHCLIETKDDIVVSNRYNKLRLSCNNKEDYATKLSSIVKDMILNITIDKCEIIDGDYMLWVDYN